MSKGGETMCLRSARSLVWLFGCLALAALVLAGPSVRAADTSWTAGAGLWHELTNWDNGLPTASVNAIINNGGTAQVLYVSSTVQHRADTLYVGYQKVSTETGSGYVEILTPLGAAGAGYLSVNQAYLGYAGTDSFGRLTCDGYFPISESSYSPSSLGVGGLLEVGRQGVGEVRIINSGMVNAQSCNIGAQAGSSGDVLVSGKGSSLWVTGAPGGPLNVGAYGQGRLTFADGGHSNSWAGTNIAAYSGSTGTLEVRHTAGPDQPNLWTSHTEWTGRIVVGGRYDEGLGQPVAGGTGELIVANNPDLGENHAAVYCIVQSPWSGGTVWVTSSGTITLTGGGEIGTVGNDVDDRGQVIIQHGGLLRGNGRIFSEVRNHGTISPGLSTGKLVAVYDYQQSDDGLLEIQLGGYNAGQAVDGFDRLEVLAGGASLAGELRIERLGSFTPNPGDIFEFLRTEGPIVGDFDAVTTVNFPSWMSAIVRAGDTPYPSRVIEIVPEPASLLLLGAGGVLLLRRRRLRGSR